MCSYGRLFIALGTLLSACAAEGLGQVSDGAPRVYSLGQRSTYQHGCFEGCACPISEEVPMRGTFVLTPVASDPLYDYYDVSDVNWTVAVGGPELRITGSGTYRIGGEVALTHQLQLELAVGNEPPTTFDSGLIPGGSGFPDLAITVSINGMYCLDTVIVLEASPVPPDRIVPYSLVRGSTYQEGCFPPCDCPLFDEQPLRGRFALVELERSSLFTEYAVVNARWRVLPLDPAGRGFRITGFGTYRVGGELAAQHQMAMELSVDGGPLTHFDSGLVVGGADFPFIDVVMTVNDLFCYDQVIHVRARPSRSSVAPTSVHQSETITSAP